MKDKANKVKVWIARDKNGSLYAYTERPHKCTNFCTNFWFSPFSFNLCKDLKSKKFPSVKWEDDEPTEAYIILAEPENKSKVSNRTFKKRLTSFLSNFMKLRPIKH